LKVYAVEIAEENRPQGIAFTFQFSIEECRDELKCSIAAMRLYSLTKRYGNERGNDFRRLEFLENLAEES
jgi:hypothetical protein